jgi:hypothetical protein
LVIEEQDIDRLPIKILALLEKLICRHGENPGFASAC